MMTLTEFLVQAGYKRVALKRNGVGHFQAAGSLKGRAVSVLLDTGAENTLVSLALARELGLSLTLLPIKGGGAGSASLDVYTVEDDRLELAEAVIRPHRLYAMDLTHVNEALAMKGAGPAEAILGQDVFDAQQAVIDYGSKSLFLRE